MFLLGSLRIMAKMCIFYVKRRCWHSSCDIFDPVSGKVSLCPLFCGRSRMNPRKVVSRG